MTPLTKANWVLPDRKKHSVVFKAGPVGPLNSSLHRYYDPGLFSHIDTLDKGGDCLWCFFGFMVVFGPLRAKCRVCEDMQVARCLCNFPPTPSKIQAQCNNNEPSFAYEIKFGPGLNSRGSLLDLKTLATLCGWGSGLPRWAGLKPSWLAGPWGP